MNNRFVRWLSLGLLTLLVVGIAPVWAQVDSGSGSSGEVPPGLIGLFIGGYFGFICCMGIVSIVSIVGHWKVNEKAGKPGWAAIIPIYNIIVLLEMVGRPTWWVLLFLIPGVNAIAMIIVCIDLAKSFGQGAGFGLGLALLPPIFFPILGFSQKYQYQGPSVM